MRSILPALLLMTIPALSPAAAQSIIEKPEFRQLVPDDAVVEKLAGGFKFLEGPAWHPLDGYLIFSDIPASKIYRYAPATKGVTVFEEPSQKANGNFYDADGNRFSCKHEARVVAVVRRGLEFLYFPDTYEGKKFNSPNDVVVKSDHTVWFTDPTYGLEGRPKEQTTNNVYCYDPEARELRAVATDFVQPNGLCFSPDEKLLYIADSGKPQHIRVFDVTARVRPSDASVGNDLANGRVFCQIDKGVPDGIRCDRHGNLFSSAEDGIHIFAPDGTRLGKILVPETPANLCFGGQDGDELFITAKTSLYRIKLTTTAPGKSERGRQ